jgi:hypothetical protein
MQSRYWDGWITYSYNWAQYRDPNTGNADMVTSGDVQGDDWYFPAYHRFHNLNLVLNIKPTSRINIYTRFGIASGKQIERYTTPRPESYPAFVYDPDDPDGNYIIEKYRWPSVMEGNHRAAPFFPMDVKLSIFGKGNNGKTRYEVYAAVENVLALFSQENTWFNPYTGEVYEGGISVSVDIYSGAGIYDVAIPIPSFGFKYSY